MAETLTPKSSLIAEEEEDAATMKHAFTLILRADYQQLKFVSYWSGGRGNPHSLTQLIIAKRYHHRYIHV